ncbi:MAG TPA: hypothetical protein VF550_11655 [Polyangia bacterium]
MRFLRAVNWARNFWQSSLLAGLLALPAGCDRTEPSEPHPSSAESTARAQPAAPAASAASLSLNPTQPGQPDGLDDLKQVLARKFDPAQMLTRPASPQGGILHIPNGWVAHAAILVKNSDGTVRRECVSSSAEVSALVEQVRGGGQ